MERLKITEGIERYEKRWDMPIDWDSLLKFVFPDDEPGIGRGDKPLKRSRKRALLTYWDRGEHLARVRPRHIQRLADYFDITLLRDIVEFTKA